MGTGTQKAPERGGCIIRNQVRGWGGLPRKRKSKGRTPRIGGGQYKLRATPKTEASFGRGKKENCALWNRQLDLTTEYAYSGCRRTKRKGWLRSVYARKLENSHRQGKGKAMAVKEC